jgi:hypothetical protein
MTDFLKEDLRLGNALRIVRLERVDGDERAARGRRSHGCWSLQTATLVSGKVGRDRLDE